MLCFDLLDRKYWSAIAFCRSMLIFAHLDDGSATFTYASAGISTFRASHFLAATTCSTTLLSTSFCGIDGFGFYTNLLVTSSLWPTWISACLCILCIHWRCSFSPRTL